MVGKPFIDLIRTFVNSVISPISLRRSAIPTPRSIDQEEPPPESIAVPTPSDPTDDTARGNFNEHAG
jgi:hypothetical protein